MQTGRAGKGKAGGKHKMKGVASQMAKASLWGGAKQVLTDVQKEMRDLRQMERTFFKSVLEVHKEKKKQVCARRRLNKLRIVTKLGIHVDAVETKDSSDADEGDESDYDDEAMDRPPARQRRASQMLLEARLERDIDDEDEINFTAEEYQGDGDSGLAALVNNQREKYNARHGEHRHFAKARQKMSLISSTRKSFPGQKSSFHVSDIHAEEHRSDGRGRLGGTMNAGDADGMHSQTSDILLFLDQYLLMEDDSMQRYKEAFTQCNIAYKEQKILILPEVVGALKVVHNNMISDKECQFCLMALDMIKQTGNGEKELVYNFHTFSVRKAMRRAAPRRCASCFLFARYGWQVSGVPVGLSCVQ